MAFTEQVKLLLSQATNQDMYYMVAQQRAAATNEYGGTHGPGVYVAPAGAVTLRSEPAIFLERLYATAEAADRRLLGPTLLNELKLRNAHVVARTLAATGHLEELREWRQLGETTEELWRGIIQVLRFESPLFSETDLQTIMDTAAVVDAAAYREGIEELKRDPHSRRYKLKPVFAGQGAAAGGIESRIHSLLREMHDAVSRIRYLRLAKTIRDGQNPAIDADRQILLSRLQAMGFSDALLNASTEIEKRAATATTDIDVKGAMDLLRTFFEEFIEEACHKVETKVGRPAPSGPKVNHFGAYRHYLKNADFIGPEESELIEKLYNFLSNQGSQKLGSAPEQLRVAHATVIEWSMLVAGRVSAFLR